MEPEAGKSPLPLLLRTSRLTHLAHEYPCRDRLGAFGRVIHNSDETATRRTDRGEWDGHVMTDMKNQQEGKGQKKETREQRENKSKPIKRYPERDTCMRKGTGQRSPEEQRAIQFGKQTNPKFLSRSWDQDECARGFCSLHPRDTNQCDSRCLRTEACALCC